MLPYYTTILFAPGVQIKIKDKMFSNTGNQRLWMQIKIHKINEAKDQGSRTQL